MSDLHTYLQDHLAGATFGVNLLKDLSEQKVDKELAALAAKLVAEVQLDRETLDRIVNSLGEESSALKDAGAWVAQKLGRTKLSTTEPFGVFEAVELMTLGVSGKIALWKTLAEIPRLETTVSVDQLKALIAQAEQQFDQLECFRLRMAKSLFRSL